MKLKLKYGLIIFLGHLILAFFLIFFQVEWTNKLLLVRTRNEVSRDIKVAWQLLNQTVHLAQWSLKGNLKENLAYRGTVVPTDKIYGDFSLNSIVDELKSTEVRAGLVRSKSGNLYAIAVKKLNNGVDLAAIDLTDNNHFVDLVQKTIFTAKENNIGTVTLFSKDIRVSTTVKKDDGSRAIGTKVSDEVKEKVLHGSKSWIGDAKVLNTVYITRYDPITSLDGKTVGMLYVGKKKGPFVQEKQRILFQNILVILISLFLSFAGVWALTRIVLQKVESLRDATLKIDEGKLGAHVQVKGEDELDQLADHFNKMSSKLRANHQFIEKQREELEQKNHQVEDLVRFISFDLKNKLSSAVYIVDLLEEGSYGKMDQEQLEGIEIIKKELRHINDFILTYMEVLNFDKDVVGVERVEVNLKRDVLNSIQKSFQERLATRNIDIEVNVPNELIIPSQINSLRILYYNILESIWEHCQLGSKLVLGLEKTAELVILSVNFQVTSEHVARYNKLFEDSREQIDLFVAQRIVEKHGGSIWTECENNHFVSIRFNFFV